MSINKIILFFALQMPTAKIYALYDSLGQYGGILNTWDEATKRMELIKRLRGKGGFRCKKFQEISEAEYYVEHGTNPTNEETDNNCLVVYTDGSAFMLDGKMVAGLGVYFGNNHPSNLAEPLLQGKPTNNRAELYAIHRALEIVLSQGGTCPVVIYSDSTYARKCLLEWRAAWERSNFKDDTIKNRDLIEDTWALLDSYPRPVEIKWVKGHAGNLGNEMADQLADCGARMTFRR